MATTYDKPRWETRVLALQALDLLIGQGNFERLEVGEKMLDLPPSNNGEDIRSFLQEIRNCNCNAKGESDNIQN